MNLDTPPPMRTRLATVGIKKLLTGKNVCERQPYDAACHGLGLGTQASCISVFMSIFPYVVFWLLCILFPPSPCVCLCSFIFLDVLGC